MPICARAGCNASSRNWETQQKIGAQRSRRHPPPWKPLSAARKTSIERRSCISVVARSGPMAIIRELSFRPLAGASGRRAMAIAKIYVTRLKQRTKPRTGLITRRIAAHKILYFIAENLSARRDEFARRISAMTEADKALARREVDASIDRLFYWAAFADKCGGTIQETTIARIGDRNS